MPCLSFALGQPLSTPLPPLAAQLTGSVQRWTAVRGEAGSSAAADGTCHRCGKPLPARPIAIQPKVLPSSGGGGGAAAPSSPVAASTAAPSPSPSPPQRLFCSFACSEEDIVRRSGGAVRQRLLAMERGVCQRCGIDAQALYKRVQALEPPERLAVLEKFMHLGTSKRGSRMLVDPKVCLLLFARLCCVCVCGIISPSSLLDGSQAGDFWQADHIVPVAEGRLQCELVAGVLHSSLTLLTPYVLCEQVEASVGCSTIAHSALLATPRKQQLCDAASAYSQVGQRTFAASLAPAKLRGLYGVSVIIVCCQGE